MESNHPGHYSDRQISFSSPVRQGRTDSEELLDMIESSPASRRHRATPVFSESDHESPDCIPLPFSFTDAANTFLNSPSHSAPTLSDIGTEFGIDFTAAAAAWESAKDVPNKNEAPEDLDPTVLEHRDISDLYGMFDADDKADVEVFSPSPVTQPLLTNLAALFPSDDETSDAGGPMVVSPLADDDIVPPFNITDVSGLFLSDDDDDDQTTMRPSCVGEGPYTSSLFAYIPDDWLADV